MFTGVYKLETKRNIQSTCTIESWDYTPALCTLAKVGRGLIRGILKFPCDDHYRPSNVTWAHDLCTFSDCLVGKIQERRQS